MRQSSRTSGGRVVEGGQDIVDDLVHGSSSRFVPVDDDQRLDDAEPFTDEEDRKYSATRPCWSKGIGGAMTS
jgi:hypothetical protein